MFGGLSDRDILLGNINIQGYGNSGPFVGDDGVRRSNEHYACMVDLMVRAEFVNEAMKFIEGHAFAARKLKAMSVTVAHCLVLAAEYTTPQNLLLKLQKKLSVCPRS